MHRSVLFEEALELLDVRPGGVYVDGTLGSGGHAAGILARGGAGTRLLGIDRDGEALERARRVLAGAPGDWTLARGNFAEMERLAGEAGIERADGVLLDLGVSSDQLECVERGFGFQNDGPLDMRMDTRGGLTARDVVNEWSEEALAGALREFGEEPRARRVARAIARERERAPIETTGRLAETVSRALGGRSGPRHPATRTFQALRIAVNRELESLEEGLEAGLRLLARGGRMAVIAFHSLEDRIVKRTFAAHAGRMESLQAGGERRVGVAPRVAVLTRKPVTAGAGELDGNPRARSARLRAVERIED